MRALHEPKPKGRRMYGIENPHLYRVLAIPWLRVLEGTPAWGKVGAFLVGLYQCLAGDLFTGIFLLLIASNGIDWFYGRSAARREGTFDPDIAAWGLQSKIAGLALVLLIRIFEAWLGELHFGAGDGVGLHTRGFVSIAIAVALFANDVESIGSNRERLGAKPIPILGASIVALRQISRSLLPRGLSDSGRNRSNSRRSSQRPTKEDPKGGSDGA